MEAPEKNEAQFSVLENDDKIQIQGMYMYQRSLSTPFSNCSIYLRLFSHFTDEGRPSEIYDMTVYSGSCSDLHRECYIHNIPVINKSNSETPRTKDLVIEVEAKTHNGLIWVIYTLKLYDYRKNNYLYIMFYIINEF